jgi:hypothetical protein
MSIRKPRTERAGERFFTRMVDVTQLTDLLASTTSDKYPLVIIRFRLEQQRFARAWKRPSVDDAGVYLFAVMALRADLFLDQLKRGFVY